MLLLGMVNRCANACLNIGTVVGLVQQEKMRSLFTKTVPKSTIVIGTIIAVQVTTSFDIANVYDI